MGLLDSFSRGDSSGDSEREKKDTSTSSSTKKQSNKSWHWGRDDDDSDDDNHGKGSFGSFFSSFSDEKGGDTATTEDASTKDAKKDDDAETEKKKKKQGKWNSFFSSLMSDQDSDKDGNNNNDAMGSIMDSWINKEGKEDEVSQDNNIWALKSAMDMYGDELQRVGKSYFGDIEITNVSPASLFYYLEQQDEVKNPSWHCRKHRFHKNLKVDDVVELNTYFHYADLAYNEDKDEIKSDLANPKHGGEPYDLIHAKMQSKAHNPAFFVGVKKGTVDQKDACEILLSIRGTASIEDVITDVLCESVEYRDGRAHKGILESGRNIVKQFKEVLDSFVEELKVQGKIKVLIVGHSLGGGAACLAGLEMEGDETMDIRVVGFGTPGCLSKEIGENAHYITTVVSDSDAIPRTSGETVVNVVLDIMEHDWVENARLDADLMLQNFQKNNGWLMSDSTREKALDRINGLLETQIKPRIKEKSTKRMDPILFPPGACIHLWRNGNGSGISGSIVPGTFFDEIDVNRTMLDDHLCAKGYGAIFLELMRQHNKDPHFRLESLYEKQEKE